MSARPGHIAPAPLRRLGLADIVDAAERILRSPSRNAVRCSADEVASFAALARDVAVLADLAVSARAGDREAGVTLLDHLARLGSELAAAQTPTTSKGATAHG